MLLMDHKLHKASLEYVDSFETLRIHVKLF
jgi:hypothetical protein